MTAFLIDTNILVYVHDPRDLVKQQQSLTLVDRLVQSGAAVLSVQCLTEFYRTVRWKLAEPLTADEALQKTDYLMRNCRVLALTPAAALDGFRACEQHSMAFWDALIWAVAKEGGVPYLLTEDFDDGATVEGVQFLNPFTLAFDISALS